MKRIQQILSSLLILQLLIFGFVFWPQGEAEALDVPLLESIAAQDITSLTIANDNGELTELALQNGEWVLASGGDYPVEQEKIDELVEKLMNAKRNRLITQTDASHKRLNIADGDFVRRVELNMADGSAETLFFGNPASFGSIHLRLEGMDEVYLVNDLTARDASAAAHDWINTSYVSLVRDDIAALTLENEHGVFELTKSEDGNWLLDSLAEDEPLLISKVNTLISRITNVRMIEPLSTEKMAEYGLDEPLATVTVTLEGDNGVEEKTLEVGSFDAENNSFVVKWSDSNFYVRVAGFNGNDFVETMQDDFIDSPEEAIE